MITNDIEHIFIEFYKWISLTTNPTVWSGVVVVGG
jgi:hypothetical protein